VLESTLAVEFDDRRIDAIFADLDQCRLPGAAVGIAIGGKPVYRKGFGLASMELPVILGPSMRMRIGSTTKHFTSLAYLLLCEEGKASLDDALGQYLPELHPVGRGVTVRQLMGHRSGLRDAYDISWLFDGMEGRVSSAELLSLYRTIDDVSAAPGSEWSYNNGGYLLLSAIIERIADRSLDEVLRERICFPVGMHDTLLRRSDTDFVPNSATLHTNRPVGGFYKAQLGTDFSGEGGLVSTVDDMLRWLAHMDAPVIGSEGTWQALKTPLRLDNGYLTDYGLGLVISNYRAAVIISHAGGVMGGNSQMLKVPAAGLDITVMVNRSDVLGMERVNKILDACLPGLAPVEQIAGERSAFSGVYRSPRTGRVIEMFEKGGQQAISMDGYELPFESDCAGKMRPVPAWSSIKQTIAWVHGAEEPRQISLDDHGNIDELQAVEPSTTANVAGITGGYAAEAIRTRVTIEETAAGPRLRTRGPFGSSAVFDLQYLGDRLWKAKSTGSVPWGAILSFATDGHSFRFSSARTRALVFRRDIDRA